MTDGTLDNVRPLRTLRVLVASRDERYRKVTRFLLERRAYLVDTLERTTTLLDRVDELRPDVVVLDASGWSAGAARRVAALGVLYPEIALVLVSDDPDSIVYGLTVLDKWVSIEHLSRHLEHGYLLAASSRR
jgi:hypothetical protein